MGEDLPGRGIPVLGRWVNQASNDLTYRTSGRSRYWMSHGPRSAP